MEYRLDEIFELHMGKTPSRSIRNYWNSVDNKWISIADLSKCNKYIGETKEYLSDQAVEESGIYKIPKNTVVMSFKLSIGKTAITSEPMYSNEAIMAFIDKHIVDLLPDYIYYMFLGRDWEIGTNKAVMGKTLNKATLSKIKVNIPSIEEQHSIVEVLDKVINVIRYREKELMALDNLVKARFVEMFGDPVRNSKGWRLKNLKEITIKLGSGATPKGGSASYKEDGISLIRSMHVYNGKFDYANLAHIDEEQAKRLNSVIVKSQDILLNITGASVARCCIVPDDILPARVNQHVCIIRSNQDEIIPIFLNSILTTDVCQKHLRNMAESAGATRQALTKEDIENLQIILPPTELQSQFAFFVQQVDKSKFLNFSLQFPHISC